MSNVLIKMDKAMDDSIFLTWINNAVDCTLKLGLSVYDAFCRAIGTPSNTSDKDYTNYLRQKEVIVCMVGLVPVVGYFAIRALQSKEKTQVDAEYDEFMNALQQRDWDSVLVDCSEEQLALLWKHPDFALTMLKKDVESNFQHVPVALLYNFEFMQSILEENLLCNYVVNHCLSCGLDVGYLAACLSKTGNEELADDLLKGHYKPEPKTRAQVELNRLSNLEILFQPKNEVANDPNEAELEMPMPPVVVKQVTDKERREEAKKLKAIEKQSLKEYTALCKMPKGKKTGDSLIHEQIDLIFNEVLNELDEQGI